MIQICHPSLDIICNKYTQYVLNLKRKYNKTNIYSDYLFSEQDNFRKYISCPANELINLIHQFNNTFPHIDTAKEDWIAFRTYMTGQYERIRHEYLQEVLTELNLSVCPYCNRHFILSVDNGRKVSAQFDHFYNKATYPYLALSFYNLIPCCPICNKAKGEMPITINPYSEGFNDDGRIEIDSLLSCILYNQDWNIVFNANERCKSNITAFALDKLYECHKDVAYEIVCKATAYNTEYLKDIIRAYKYMGLDANLINRILWGYYLENNELSNRPLSKMASDILKQMGIDVIHE